MTKVPRAGLVKTRMNLPGDVASQLAVDLLEAVVAIVDRAHEQLQFDRVLAVALSAGDSREDAAALLPEGWRLVLQRGPELGDRIQAAAEDAGAEEVVVLGSDAPTMPVERLLEAFLGLSENGAVFGPTEDGGYYLVGLRGRHPSLFARIPWSTDRVMEETRLAAERAGISIGELSAWYDVDRPEDLHRAIADGFSCRASAFALVPLPHGKDRA